MESLSLLIIRFITEYQAKQICYLQNKINRHYYKTMYEATIVPVENNFHNTHVAPFVSLCDLCNNICMSLQMHANNTMYKASTKLNLCYICFLKGETFRRKQKDLL